MMSLGSGGGQSVTDCVALYFSKQICFYCIVSVFRIAAMLKKVVVNQMLFRWYCMVSVSSVVLRTQCATY